MAVVSAVGEMQCAAIVPHGQHVFAPMVAIDIFVLRHVLVEEAEDGGGFRFRHALDALRIDGADIERLAARHRMGAHKRMGMGLVGLFADDDLHGAVALACLLLMGEEPPGAIGQRGGMDGDKAVEHFLHDVGEIIVSARAIGIERVAADGGHDLGVKKRGGGRRVLKAPVGMPARAEIACLLVRLAAQFENMGAAFHRLDEGIYAERTDLKGKGFKLIMRQWLIGKPDDRMIGPCLFHRLKLGGRQGTRQVEPRDFGPESARVRRDVDRLRLDSGLRHDGFLSPCRNSGTGEREAEVAISVERFAADGDAMQQAAFAVIIVGGIVPCGAIIPEGDGSIAPLEAAGEFGPRGMLVEILEERLALFHRPAFETDGEGGIDVERLAA